MAARAAACTPVRGRAAESGAMREVYVDSDSALVGLYQSVLTGAGIRCFVRGYHDGYTGIAGIVTPTLCITDDADYPRALELLREAQAGETAARPDWTCVDCGEEVPGSFDVCWKCGEERPG